MPAGSGRASVSTASAPMGFCQVEVTIDNHGPMPGEAICVGGGPYFVVPTEIFQLQTRKFCNSFT